MDQMIFASTLLALLFLAPSLSFVPTNMHARVTVSPCINNRLQMKATPAVGGSRIWEVIHQLETEGLSTSNPTSSTSCQNEKIGTFSASTTKPTLRHEQRLNELTMDVARILREWGEKWAGQPEWQTLLNKKSLLHEVEESIVALSFLLEWLERRENEHKDDANDGPLPPVTLVDVCCGKGILSMLASYLLRHNPTICNIIMLDKQTDINWNYIHASNECAENDGRPIIVTWGGCNLNEIDSILNRLDKDHMLSSDNKQQFALIGIHLCKLLSPSCAGLANALGPNKCPFLCLAPCCLPRAVLQSKKRLKGSSVKTTTTVSVREYETEEERKKRMEANTLRAGAKKRSFRDHPCYLCSDTGHPVDKCRLLPSDESECIEIFQKATAQIPWYV